MAGVRWLRDQLYLLRHDGETRYLWFGTAVFYACLAALYFMMFSL